MTLGDRIKEQRKKLGFTQPELAEKLELSVVMIKKMEGNKKQPSIETLEKLSQILSVPTDYLIGNTSISDSRKYKLVEDRYLNWRSMGDEVNFHLDLAFESMLKYLSKKDGNIYSEFTNDIRRVAEIFGYTVSDDFFESSDEVRVFYYVGNRDQRLDFIKMLNDLMSVLHTPHEEEVDTFIYSLEKIKVVRIADKQYAEEYIGENNPLEILIKIIKNLYYPKHVDAITFFKNKLKRTNNFIQANTDIPNVDLVPVYEKILKKNFLNYIGQSHIIK